MEEIWKDIKGYEGIYKISSLGNIVSLDRYILGVNGVTQFFVGLKKKLRVEKRSKYLLVSLSNCNISKTWRLHQLLAIHFLGHTTTDPNKIVDHIDNDPSNNSLDNLQIVSPRINTSKDRVGGSSKFTGVYLNKKKWCVSIRINRKKIFLGAYDVEYDAGMIYKLALKNIEKHRTNSKEDNHIFREYIKKLYYGS